MDHLHGPVWRLARDDHDCQWHLAWDDQISNRSQPRRKTIISCFPQPFYILICCMKTYIQANHMIAIIRKSWPHHGLACSFGLLWWQLEIRRAFLWLHQSCTLSYDFMFFHVLLDPLFPFSTWHFSNRTLWGCEVFDRVSVELKWTQVENLLFLLCFFVTLSKFLLSTGRFFYDVILTCSWINAAKHPRGNKWDVLPNEPSITRDELVMVETWLLWFWKWFPSNYHLALFVKISDDLL